jgi:hypothetical protein
LGAPRIAAPNADVTCPVYCDEDYVVVVRDTDGSDWYIWADGYFDGSHYQEAYVNDNGNGEPDIICYRNDRPVVAWPDGGVAVMWELHDVDGTCDQIASAGTCPNTGTSGAYHVVVEYLEDDLDELNNDDAFSVFNIDLGEVFLYPSISDGEGDNIGAVDVLYTGYQRKAGMPFILEVDYKSNAFGAPNLKRGDDDDDALSTIPNGVAFPNPFVLNVTIQARGVPGGLNAVSVSDALGRICTTQLMLGNDGSLTVTFSESETPDGVYFLALTGSDESRFYSVMRLGDAGR